ncbi:carbon-nitrogen hydrolase [Ascodesmis nigricans]|uniref:Carbon-nitrogen hydrolase n=1 Tax=Ascodesmis nigricans TaxID=341454 RepID=A0A4S2MXW7_9PEZI|nr:carbon-nitrogen hydrolase [Ascodesmis nigricans]
MVLIAVGQFCATSDIEANTAICMQIVEKAVSQGAKILFLPEASDYLPTPTKPSHTLCHPPTTSPLLTTLLHLSTHHSLPILVGVHTPSPLPTHVYNALLYLTPTSGITATYNKLHLFTLPSLSISETSSTLPGDSLTPPIPTPIGQLGLQICFDLRFGEALRRLVEMGAEVVCYPSAFTVETGREHWEVLVRARAVEGQCWVVAAAQGGDNGEGRRCWGGSLVVDPWGRVRWRGRTVDDGVEGWEVGVVEVEMGMVQEVRERLRLVRRGDLFGGC